MKLNNFQFSVLTQSFCPRRGNKANLNIKQKSLAL